MIRYTCPTCQKTIGVTTREEAPSRPFCSRRCQLIDLGKWLNAEYVISDPILPDDVDELPDVDSTSMN
ncbi:MAG: DNA gyrase inhibitor YacG [Phycisphaerae bacterium]|nr:MAG: DNA gyrase inhibitor YacG [Phycisphaerae bacterium]